MFKMSGSLLVVLLFLTSEADCTQGRFLKKNVYRTNYSTIQRSKGDEVRP